MVIKKLWNSIVKNPKVEEVVSEPALVKTIHTTSFRELKKVINGYKLTEEQFVDYLKHPQQPENIMESYRPVLARMVLVKSAELTPMVIWDIDTDLIYVTSQEYLEGRFN